MKRWPTALRFHLRGAHKRYVAFISVLDGKNPIVIGPLISDEHGTIVITRQDLTRNLDQARRDYPMDYKDTRLVPPKRIALDVQSRESIQTRSLALAPFYPNEASKLATLLRSEDVSFTAVEHRFISEITGQTKDFVIDLHTVD